MVKEPNVWQADGASVFKLRDTGAVRFGEPVLENAVYFIVQVSRPTFEGEGNLLAAKIAALLNESEELDRLEAMRQPRRFWLIRHKGYDRFWHDDRGEWVSETEDAVWWRNPADAHTYLKGMVAKTPELGDKLELIYLDDAEQV